jgi:hypothetical protein
MYLRWVQSQAKRNRQDLVNVGYSFWGIYGGTRLNVALTLQRKARASQ